MTPVIVLSSSLMHLVVDGVVTVDGGCYPVGNDPVGGFDPRPL